MKKKVNWGVLGCAAIARVRTIPGLLQADNAHLLAVASRGMEKAEGLREQFGADRAYGSYEELLEDPDVDAGRYSPSQFPALPVGRESGQSEETHFMREAAGIK